MWSVSLIGLASLLDLLSFSGINPEIPSCATWSLWYDFTWNKRRRPHTSTVFELAAKNPSVIEDLTAHCTLHICILYYYQSTT